MKQLYPMLAALCLTTAAAHAQDFRPFRLGTVYQYQESATPGDTIHTLRLESAAKVGTDSVFKFNGRVVKLRMSTSGGTGCRGPRVLRPDNLFGATLTKRAGSEFVLTAANGRTFTLKPRAALNQSWQAVPGGVTALVLSRSATTTFGQVDSTAVISLSDSKIIILSKKFGLLSGPALGSYLNGQSARQLTLSALPTLHLGTEKTGPLAIHDYQPGDVFLRYSSREMYTGSKCSEAWRRDSVLTRTTSLNGDTVKYTIWTRTLAWTAPGYPGAPPSLVCSTFSSPGGTTLSAGGVYTLTAVRTPRSNPVTLTSTIWSSLPPAQGSWVTLASNYYSSASFNNRIKYNTRLQQVCPSAPVTGDSLHVSDIVDIGENHTYAHGLGETQASSGEIYYYSNTTLIGYRKVNLPTSTGVETYGSLRTFANILKAIYYQPAATTAAFPNPFARELTLKFDAAKPQPVQVQLYNALGQRVHTQQANATAGTQQVQLALPTLPAGLYTLHLAHDGRTEVLKVVKAE